MGRSREGWVGHVTHCCKRPIVQYNVGSVAAVTALALPVMLKTDHSYFWGRGALVSSFFFETMAWHINLLTFVFLFLIFLSFFPKTFKRYSFCFLFAFLLSVIFVFLSSDSHIYFACTLLAFTQ